MRFEFTLLNVTKLSYFFGNGGVSNDCPIYGFLFLILMPINVQFGGNSVDA